MGGVVVAQSELDSVRAEVHDIKQKLAPIEQAIPMLVELQRESLEVQKTMAAQQEKNISTERRIEKCEVQNDKQNEKITELQINTKVNAAKIAGAVSVITVIVGLGLNSIFG